MSEKVDIFELQINVDQAAKDAGKAADEVAKLREELNELKKAENADQEAIAKKNAELKASQDEYKRAQGVVDGYTKATKESVGSLEKWEAQNKALRAEQRKLNLETEEGQKRNKEINKQIDENSAKIKENSDQRKQEILNIGNYPGAFGKASQAVQGLAGGFQAAGQAAKAFLANPIGIILTAIVAVVGLLVKAFKRSEESMNKLKAVGGALSGIFSLLLSALKPVVDFIANSVIKTFEALGKVADKVMGLVSKGLGALGFENAAAAVDKFSQSVANAAKAGRELADMEAQLQKSQRESRKIQLDYQKDAEKLRQLRDDESRSIADRIKSNQQLGQVLKKQIAEELAIANQAVAIAQKRIELEGESTENLDALGVAMTEVADIQERITSQESEQLANLNSLRKEANDLRLKQLQEIADREKAISEDEANFAAEAIKAMNEEIAAGLEYSDVILDQSEADMQTRRDNRLQAVAIQYQAEMELAEGNYEAQYQLQLEELARQEEAEIESARKIAASKEEFAKLELLITKKYNSYESKLEKEKNKIKLDLAKDFANNIAVIAGENTKVGKAASIAATIISTYQAATSSYASLASIPIVGPALGAVSAAAAVAAGFRNVQEIMKVKSGLPGESSPSISTGGASTFSSTPSAITPEVGAGIVSRETNIQQSTEPTMQTAVVVDEVTAAQRVESKNQVASII